MTNVSFENAEELLVDSCVGLACTPPSLVTCFAKKYFLSLVFTHLLNIQLFESEKQWLVNSQ